MFSPGEVVFVVSDQAKGYKTRDKYHLCICGFQGFYFFINSKSWEGSFTLTHSDFEELPKDESFIACNTVLEINDQYMKENSARSIGQLSPSIVSELIDHLNDCEVLSEFDKERVIDGLSGAL